MKHAESILAHRAKKRRNGACSCGLAFDTAPPAFDYDACRGMSAEDVRSMYPRHTVQCSRCGATTIRYASFLHYIAGDW
ncbi:MAG: hypothetical protein RIS45_246 [Planctomycetota bacterium]|jgi:hypothetical protein